MFDRVLPQLGGDRASQSAPSRSASQWRRVVLMLAAIGLIGVLSIPASGQDDTAEDSELEQLRAQIVEFEHRHLNQEAELSRLRKAVATAQLLDRRNQDLEAQMIELERSVQIAEQEARSLRDRTERDWFLRGAGVMLAGLLLGVLVSRLQRPKAPSWRDL